MIIKGTNPHTGHQELRSFDINATEYLAAKERWERGEEPAEIFPTMSEEDANFILGTLGRATRGEGDTSHE